MPEAPFESLQRWYAAQCNGEWERTRGITIETLNHCGWLVLVDLGGTALENQPMIPVRNELSPLNWIDCEVLEGQFRGQGDASKLEKIVSAFRDWVAGLPQPVK